MNTLNVKVAEKVGVQYDYNIYSTDIDRSNSKHQIIIFIIYDMKHIPIISFCYEDVRGEPENFAKKKVEFFIEGTTCKRVNDTLYFELPEFAKLRGVDFEIIGRKLEFCPPGQAFAYTLQSEHGIIAQTVFNNFNYVEKSIVDYVSDHTDQIDQIVNKVKDMKLSINEIVNILKIKNII